MVIYSYPFYVVIIQLFSWIWYLQQTKLFNITGKGKVSIIHGYPSLIMDNYYYQVKIITVFNLPYNPV